MIFIADCKKPAYNFNLLAVTGVSQKLWQGSPCYFHKGHVSQSLQLLTQSAKVKKLWGSCHTIMSPYVAFILWKGNVQQLEWQLDPAFT